jgi:hypothetical protein
MRRLVIFFCVLFLMLDLADDGCLGRAKFVSPISPVKSLEVSYKDYGSKAHYWQHEILFSNLQFPLSSIPQSTHRTPCSAKPQNRLYLSSQQCRRPPRVIPLPLFLCSAIPFQNHLSRHYDHPSGGNSLWLKCLQMILSNERDWLPHNFSVKFS